MEQGTKEDYELMGNLYDEDLKNNRVKRILNLMNSLKGVKNGGKIDLYEHSLQVIIGIYIWSYLQCRLHLVHLVMELTKRWLFVPSYMILENFLAHKIMEK